MSPPLSPHAAHQSQKTTSSLGWSMLKNTSPHSPKPLLSTYPMLSSPTMKTPRLSASLLPLAKLSKNSPQYPLEPWKSFCALTQTLMKPSMPLPMDSSPPSTTAPWPLAKSSTPPTQGSNNSANKSPPVALKSPIFRNDWEPSTSPPASNPTWATYPTPSPSALGNVSSHNLSGGWAWEKSRWWQGEKETN